uniref:Uncharacterized protein LOC111119935 n=1 Tax=Crassostrea virginica TaxID=6565 RepID=A0A8B8CM08_CRAVI|nr:uncharacterized protein LOC111119935 [Crassostrea virginica]
MSSFLFGIVLAFLFVAVDFSKVFHEKNSNIHNNGEEKRVDKFKNYPDIKRSTLDGSSTNGDHWCCSINTTKQTVVSSVKVVYTTQAVQTASNHSCGLLGLQTCTNHHTEYKTVSRYVTTYAMKLIQIECPNENLVCCDGSIHLAGKCISLSEMSHVLQTLG